MIDSIHPLRHEHRLLLEGHRFRVVAHDVIQSGQHAQALRNLRMHGAVHVVQQIQRLADQLVALLQVAVLDLTLAGRVEVVGVAGARIDVLDDGKYVDDVLLEERQPVLRVEIVLAQQYLHAVLHAERAQQAHPMQAVLGARLLDAGARQLPVVVRLDLRLDARPQRFRRQIRPLVVVDRDQPVDAPFALAAPLRVLAVQVVHAGLRMRHRAGRQQAVEEVADRRRQAHHFRVLQVADEDVLGGARHQLADRDAVQIVELLDRGQHFGDLAQVAHVDTARVQTFDQRDAVHRRDRVLEAFAYVRRHLRHHQEVGGVLHQLLLLAELLGAGVRVAHAHREHVRVEAHVELGLLQRADRLRSLLHDLLGAFLQLALLAAGYRVRNAFDYLFRLVRLHRALADHLLDVGRRFLVVGRRRRVCRSRRLLVRVAVFDRSWRDGRLLAVSALARRADLLQVRGRVLYEHHVARLDERVDQLLAQAAQFMLMLDGKAERLHLLAQLLALELQEVHVRRKGAQQVQYVVAPVVADNAFALDRRAQFDFFVLIVDHFVGQNFQMLRRLAQQYHVLFVRDHRFAEVDGPVHDGLLLFTLQNTRYDGLRRYTVASIVDDHRA